MASYYDETSRRDDSAEAFGEEDLPVRAAGIRRALSSRPDLLELWGMVTSDPKDALSLLEDALRQAVPATLGLRSNTGGDTLDGLFRRSRQILKSENRELVLIFEDLTQFGLVDGELYDQFATAPSEDSAPLRVVFAVTSGAFDRMDKTVSTRVTDVFEVGGSALSEPQKFVGRYLNLVRVGGTRTRELWSAGGEHEAPTWMENACSTRNQGQPCEFLETCHSSFGKVEIDGLGDVGLYPYSAPALRRAMDHLGDDGTPRLVLDECISTNLIEADARIADGTYPHPRVDYRFDRHVTISRDVLVQDVPAAEKDRVYRARLYWGDERPLPRGIEEAFSLPVAGDAAEPATTPAPDSSSATSDAPDTKVPPSSHTAPSPLEPLWHWQNGATMIEDEANYYRTTLLALTQSRLQLDQSLVHIFNGRGKALLGRLLNQTSFFIEAGRGAGAGKESIRFDIKPTTETVRLLVAARWFREHGHFVPEQGNWTWPAGFKPDELMIELETQLDHWAEATRKKFLEVSGGSAIARDAVGLRAAALLAVGHDVTELRSTADVLARTSAPARQPSDAWAGVQAAAEQALGLKTEEYVAEFAAVRQGSTGGPQLVDTLELDEALAAWLADPLAALERIEALKPEPDLTLQARKMLTAMKAAERAERREIQEAATTLLRGLEEASPAAVADRALQIGDTAKGAGYFRPPEAWGSFRRAIEVLEEQGEESVPLTALQVRAGVAGPLLAQWQGRRAIRMSKALGVVMKVLAATAAECRRGDDGAGDVGSLRDAVKGQVAELDDTVKSLAGEGRNR